MTRGLLVAYWWVNHKTSFKIEIRNGALWAPIEANDGRILAGHRTVAQVEPDDLIVSFAGGKARHIGRAADRASFCVIPKEYGESRWNRAGRILPVQWHVAGKPFHPKQHLQAIVPLLPKLYSPLQTNGNANITYLSSIDDELGRYVLAQMGFSEGMLPSARGAADSHSIAERVEADWADTILSNVGETEREAVGRARTKQGLFRNLLYGIESSCRVTGISDPNLLIASHAKPWSVCNNAERVDPHNGLMLAPHVDHLFDRGLMRFLDDGSWSFSPRLTDATISQLGLPPTCSNPLPFRSEQRQYLRYHRDNRFKGALS